MANSCGGCDREWTGMAECHCKSCHLHFGSITAFDRHRGGSFAKRFGMAQDGRFCIEVGDYSKPMGKGTKPRLVSIQRASGLVWVTERRDD